MRIRFMRYNTPEFIFLADAEMPAAPRRDEMVTLTIDEKERAYRVHHVTWHPGHMLYDVIVVVVNR